MSMSSRKTSDSTSASGVTFVASENLAALPQKGIFISGGNAQSLAIRGLTGMTIRGQVVGTVEHWGDGTVWDVANSRSLSPGIDFDPAILHRGGF